MSRTKNSIRNVQFTIIGQSFGLVASFVARTVFVHYLSAEYLGLNGLFTNVLSILSLAELGIGSAIVYSMYEPLAKGEEKRLKALMRIYRKAYNAIGIWMCGSGLLVTPFLNFFIKEIPNIPNIQVIYLMFVGNSALTYFFSYKRSLIIADQKKYIDSVYHYASVFLLNIIQIIVLVLTQNYILFLSISLIVTLAENVLISLKADKLYPYLKNYNGEKLQDEDKKTIIKNIKAMFFHRIGTVLVIGTDNLLISKFVGLVSIGVYSNYLLILNAIKLVLGIIFQSITSSVGNLGVTESKIRIYRIFNIIDFIGFWIYGFSSIALFNLFNPFIVLWLGKDFLFPMSIVFFIVFNFYIQGQRSSVLTFKDAMGLFWYDRYKPLVESAINLITSIFLVIRFGVLGVLIGTSISTLTTAFWIEPFVLYKYGLNSSLKSYFWIYTKRVVTIFVIGAITWFLCTFVPTLSISGFLLRILICALIPNLLLGLVYRNTLEFRYLIQMLKSLHRNNEIEPNP